MHNTTGAFFPHSKQQWISVDVLEKINRLTFVGGMAVEKACTYVSAELAGVSASEHAQDAMNPVTLRRALDKYNGGLFYTYIHTWLYLTLIVDPSGSMGP